MKKLLNLGCGYRFHPDWININFISTGEGVIAHNLNQGIPFPDAYFDMVYHSHLIEHFSKASAELLMQECYRVLRPKGILRVVTPDLEQICRTYLIALEKASSRSKDWAMNYEWILLEMFDQTVRNYSGGAMAEYLSNENIVNEEFVLSRIGTEAKNIIEVARTQHERSRIDSKQKGQFSRWLKIIYQLLRYPVYCRELLLKTVIGKVYTTLQIGRFRQSGEIHQWMYDRYSLALLMKKSGFKNIVQRVATESYNSDWNWFNLDIEPDGKIYKPDSLFMEGIKP